MKIEVHSVCLFLFTIIFVLFTIIGTLSHEYGHIIVAKYFGYKTTMYYGSMTSERNDRCSDYKTIDTEYKHEIPFTKKPEYNKRIKRLKLESFLITIGGPSQTILTGLFGLFVLFFRRKYIQNSGLKIIDWLMVFLSLFWLREIFNLVVSVASGLFNGTGILFAGDEAKISKYFELPIGTAPIILGVLGLIISILIIFKVIPIKLRLTFIISGLLGGIAGFILWMKILGPMVLPF